MNVNLSVWQRYQPGFVDPEYVPYMRERTKDRWGNEVEINRWEVQGPETMVQPELVRINKGMTFQRMFEEDPCPVGWTKNPGASDAYCYQAPLRHEPVFYTDKAFIAKNQYFGGSTDSGGVLNRNQSARQISEQSDLRSVNPLTGDYTVYYQPVSSSAKVRYTNPSPSGVKYDTSWNLSRQQGYATLATPDSYLS